MDVARCTIDNRNYDIPTFEALGDAQISHYRRRLICPECKGPSFYRKESTSGQAACFGARPHAPTCSLAAAEPSRGGGLGPDQDERINLGERIEVDFNYGANPNVNLDPGEPNNPQGQGGRYVGQGRRRNTVMHRRLSTLLRNLMYSADFRQSNQLIALPEGEFRIRDFFIKFEDSNDNDVNEYRGYWGLISDAGLSREDPPSLWLNSGGRDDVSIVISDAQSDEFLKRYPFDELEEFAGSYALVFGRLKESRQGKKYLTATDMSKLTISL